MKYYLRKESFEGIIKEIIRPNGEIIPERKYVSEDRALYYPYDLTRRRYRDSYPIPHNKGFRMYTCKTLKHIMEERQNLFDYCGEWFDVYDDNGKVNIENLCISKDKP
jgi:hypothetical protein